MLPSLVLISNKNNYVITFPFSKLKGQLMFAVLAGVELKFEKIILKYIF